MLRIQNLGSNLGIAASPCAKRVFENFGQQRQLTNPGLRQREGISAKFRHDLMYLCCVSFWRSRRES